MSVLFSPAGMEGWTVVVLLASLFSVGDSHEKESQLICSDEPVVALAGEDVILPCHLEPPMGPGSGKVLWSKPGLDKKFILVYHQGQMIREEQNPSYEKRTALFEDQLKDGNVSLKLSRVKVSDAGRYLCTHEAAVKNTYIHLTVVAVSSVIINNVTMKIGEGVLPCKSTGWFPEPEMLFLDQDRNQIPADSTETVQGPDGLYSVSRTVVVDQPGNFTCRVHLKDFNQTREAVISIPEFVFTGNVMCLSLLVIGGAVLAIRTLISLETDQKKCDHTVRKFFSWALQIVFTCVVIFVWIVMMPRRNTFKDSIIFFSFMSCVTVVLIANLTTFIISLMKKFRSGLLQYPLSFYWILIYFVLLVLLILMHIIAPILYNDFYTHPFPVVWIMNAACVVLITDVFVIIVTLLTCCQTVQQESLRQIFKKLFCKDQSPARSESLELPTRRNGQQVETGREASVSAGDGCREDLLTTQERRGDEENR